VEPEIDYPFQYDEERLVMLSDFWHDSDEDMEEGLLGSNVFLARSN